MAAPLGNKFSVGGGGGRPPLFKNEQELIEECDSYFEYLKQENEEPTITGLAIWLGFESRQSLYDYEKHDEFSYIIKKARLFVENGYEKGLRTKSFAGSIFALKQMGWKDAIDNNHLNNGKDFEPTTIVFKKFDGD